MAAGYETDDWLGEFDEGFRELRHLIVSTTTACLYPTGVPLHAGSKKFLDITASSAYNGNVSAMALTEGIFEFLSFVHGGHAHCYST